MLVFIPHEGMPGSLYFMSDFLFLRSIFTSVFCRIMIASLSFLLDYEKIEDDDDDSDALSSEDELTQNPQVVLNKEAVYKVWLAAYIL